MPPMASPPDLSTYAQQRPPDAAYAVRSRALSGETVRVPADLLQTIGGLEGATANTVVVAVAVLALLGGRRSATLRDAQVAAAVPSLTASAVRRQRKILDPVFAARRQNDHSPYTWRIRADDHHLPYDRSPAAAFGVLPVSAVRADLKAPQLALLAAASTFATPTGQPTRSHRYGAWPVRFHARRARMSLATWHAHVRLLEDDGLRCNTCR